MELVNLTPHAISIVHADGGITTIPPSGTVARVLVTRTEVGKISVSDDPNVAEVTIYRSLFGDVENLPDPDGASYYLVSAIVANAPQNATRDDLLIVDQAVRNADGQVIGARAFARVN